MCIYGKGRACGLVIISLHGNWTQPLQYHWWATTINNCSFPLLGWLVFQQRNFVSHQTWLPVFWERNKSWEKGSERISLFSIEIPVFSKALQLHHQRDLMSLNLETPWSNHFRVNPSYCMPICGRSYLFNLMEGIWGSKYSL